MDQELIEIRRSDDVFCADSTTKPHHDQPKGHRRAPRVAELCHRRGALVCIDSTLASPINHTSLSPSAPRHHPPHRHPPPSQSPANLDVIVGCVSGLRGLGHSAGAHYQQVVLAGMETRREKKRWKVEGHLHGVTSAKPPIHTVTGLDLNGFVKMEGEKCLVLRFMDDN
uniref:Uncharacterized protein n=1 Tax=Oryza barthii TaxID=65489 RepID=A0A0D3G2V4_9ORYZ